MKMFCSSGGENSEAAIFQCPVMARFSLGTSEGIAESTSLRNRRHNFTNGSCNGITSSVKGEKDFSHCNNNNNNDNDIANDVKADGDHTNNYLNGMTKGNVSEIEASPRMKELFEGLNEPGDSRNPPEAPEWLDRELFNQGRQFYHKYLFCIFFSDLLALLMMFSISRILRPLIYTDKSDTPTRALRRYVSTILHIITWFTGDVWDPNDQARRDVLSVRSVHNKSADIFNSSKHYDKVKSIGVNDKGHPEPSCPFSPAVRQDLQTQAKPGLRLESPDNPALYISQWDMSVTQYSFLGIILAHPHQVGAWGVTEKELESLVHFWRGIGWLLGIEDKYNFCNGSATDVRRLCFEMEKLVMVPNISVSDWNHEHMSFSLIQGINEAVPGLSYPAMFRFLADTLGLSVPTFTNHMSFKYTFQYWLMRFVFHILFLIPGAIYIFNELLKLSLRIIQDRYPNWFPKSRNPANTVTTSGHT